MPAMVLMERSEDNLQESVLSSYPGSWEWDSVDKAWQLCEPSHHTRFCQFKVIRPPEVGRGWRGKV